MKKVEFYEFLGRSAELLFEGHEPLVRKLERLLSMLLTKIAGLKLIIPDPSRDFDSESDCPDDLVEDLKS